MDWPQIETLVREGWEVGGHTVNHVRLSELSSPELEQELEEPLREIRRRFRPGRISVAYRYGTLRDVPAEAVSAARGLGFFPRSFASLRPSEGRSGKSANRQNPPSSRAEA